MFLRPVTHILLILIFTLLCSCRTTRVQVNYNDEVDFLDFNTYAWLKPMAKDDTGYISLGEQNMHKMLNESLAAKGMVLADDDKADVLVSINVTDKEKVYYRTYGLSYYNRFGGYTSPFIEPEYYTESTIVLAFVNPKTKQSIWEGTARDSHYDKIKQEDLQKIVDAFFKHYPPIPAGMDEYDPKLDKFK